MRRRLTFVTLALSLATVACGSKKNTSKPNANPYGGYGVTGGFPPGYFPPDDDQFAQTEALTFGRQQQQISDVPVARVRYEPPPAPRPRIEPELITRAAYEPIEYDEEDYGPEVRVTTRVFEREIPIAAATDEIVRLTEINGQEVLTHPAELYVFPGEVVNLSADAYRGQVPLGRGGESLEWATDVPGDLCRRGVACPATSNFRRTPYGVTYAVPKTMKRTIRIAVRSSRRHVRDFITLKNSRVYARERVRPTPRPAPVPRVHSAPPVAPRPGPKAKPRKAAPKSKKEKVRRWQDPPAAPSVPPDAGLDSDEPKVLPGAGENPEANGFGLKPLLTPVPAAKPNKPAAAPAKPTPAKPEPAVPIGKLKNFAEKPADGNAT